jgi:hypothetical protein
VSSKIFPGAWLKFLISNSKAVLLVLVKPIENRRKFRKYKPNFVGLLVKSNTTFVKLVQAVS